MGIVPNEHSEEEWLVLVLREFKTRRAQRDYMARRRRENWPEDAWWEYRDLMEGERKTTRSLPDELFLTELDQRGRPVPPKRRKYDAWLVAKWAYRRRREGATYSDIADEAGEDGVYVEEKTIERTIASNDEIWRLAEKS
jgi:hypothetical protein